MQRNPLGRCILRQDMAYRALVRPSVPITLKSCLNRRLEPVPKLFLMIHQSTGPCVGE
jgi:hypothetical protein